MSLVLWIIGLLDFSVLVFIIPHDPGSLHFSLLCMLFIVLALNGFFGNTIRSIVGVI